MSYHHQEYSSLSPREAVHASSCPNAIDQRNAKAVGQELRIASQKRERIEFIDIMRGILILLMLSSHAADLADVPPSHFLRSKWWLPRGWAFDSFVTLSGFSAAVVFPWQENTARAGRAVRKRAVEILLVMFFSNIILLTIHHMLSNQTQKLLHADWWIGLLTLKTEYSISGALLPTALLLVAAPLLARFHRRLGLTTLLILSLLFAFTVWSIHSVFAVSLSNHHVLDVLFGEGVGGFPVLPMVSRGVLGFSLGLAWKKWKPELPSLALLLFIPAFSLLSWAVTVGLQATQAGLYYTLKALVRFVVVMAAGILISRVAGAFSFSRLFAILGEYTLFCFVLHRIILQFLAVTSSRICPSLLVELKYITSVITGIVILPLLCICRRRYLSFDRGLKKVYL